MNRGISVDGLLEKMIITQWRKHLEKDKQRLEERPLDLILPLKSSISWFRTGSLTYMLKKMDPVQIPEKTIADYCSQILEGIKYLASFHLFRFFIL